MIYVYTPLKQGIKITLGKNEKFPEGFVNDESVYETKHWWQFWKQKNVYKAKYLKFKPFIDEIFNRNIKFKGVLIDNTISFYTAYIFVNNNYIEINKSVFLKLIEEYSFEYITPIKTLEKLENKELNFLYFTDDNKQL